MPWLNTNPELLNSIKELKNNLFLRLSLDGENKNEINNEDNSVRTRCITFMTLYQDCLEQTNNDTQFCLPYYKLFHDCKEKAE